MSHPKNELDELLHYLTPHERAELEALATPPSDACPCVAVLDDAHMDAETDAVRQYVERNGYAPPQVIVVSFVDGQASPAW